MSEQELFPREGMMKPAISLPLISMRRIGAQMSRWLRKPVAETAFPVLWRFPVVVTEHICGYSSQTQWMPLNPEHLVPPS